jgi:hypothetical protein
MFIEYIFNVIFIILTFNDTTTGVMSGVVFSTDQSKMYVTNNLYDRPYEQS